MKKIKLKKSFLAATLVVALGAAVYLNWSMSKPKTVSKTLGESKYVSATVSGADSKAVNSDKISESKLSQEQLNKFSEARTERDKCQDKIIDTAKETLNLENTSEDKQNEAQSQVAGMLKNFNLQNTVESTLKAKGFSDCLCYISDSGCVLTVAKNELTEDSAMIVKSTVQAQTNIGFDKISIVTV